MPEVQLASTQCKTAISVVGSTNVCHVTNESKRHATEYASDELKLTIK
jgi:hypothetical protein